jgi:ubiquinone/menaquinone biosynthesis C-methylase UbiE
MAVEERWRQVTEEDILEANVKKYNDDNIVNFYKDFEEPRYSYIEYEVIFRAMLEEMSASLGRRIRAVDMCGGAGKAAFVIKQCDPTCEVTLVDLSEKMLNIARQRLEREKCGSINIVLADAFSFLEEAGEYDLIVFSSAIHHFKDPLKLLTLAAQKLSGRGAIITIADPTPLTKTRRYKFFEFLLTNRQGKTQAVKRYLGRFYPPWQEYAAAEDACDIAEYQTFTGIDDKALAYQLSMAGLYPLVHLRYPAGEPYMVKIMPYIGLCWAFSFILRKGQHEDDIKMAVRLKDRLKKDLPFRFQYI